MLSYPTTKFYKLVPSSEPVFFVQIHHFDWNNNRMQWECQSKLLDCSLVDWRLSMKPAAAVTVVGKRKPFGFYQTRINKQLVICIKCYELWVSQDICFMCSEDWSQCRFDITDLIFKLVIIHRIGLKTS